MLSFPLVLLIHFVSVAQPTIWSPVAENGRPTLYPQHEGVGQQLLLRPWSLNGAETNFATLGGHCCHCEAYKRFLRQVSSSERCGSHNQKQKPGSTVPCKLTYS